MDSEQDGGTEGTSLPALKLSRKVLSPEGHEMESIEIVTTGRTSQEARENFQILLKEAKKLDSTGER